MNKLKKINSNNYLYFLGICIAIIGIFIYSFIVFKYNTISFKDESLYQYVKESKKTFNGKTKIIKKRKSIKIKNKNTKDYSYLVPIYFDNSDKLIVLNKMNVINIDTFKENTINYFTYFYLKNDKIIAEYRNKTLDINNSLLYNDDNVYIVLSNAKVFINNKTYVLSPLSYIQILDNTVYVYNKGSNQYFYKTKVSDDILVSINDKRINLNKKMILNKDDNKLLSSTSKKFDNYIK